MMKRYVGSCGISDFHFAIYYFSNNLFYRMFSNRISLTEQTQTLQDMLGSGAVRDMWEAA